MTAPRRRPMAVVVLVVLTLVAGIVLQPDDGTAVSRPEGVGLHVDGADHAKPLPKASDALDLVRSLVVPLAVLVLLALLGTVVRLGRERRSSLRSHPLGRASARRGPPALA